MSAPATRATAELRQQQDDQGVVTVTLSNPARKNAIPVAQWDELQGVFHRIARDPKVRVVIIEGDGADFSSGADLSDAGDSEEHVLDFMRCVGDSFLALQQIQRPTIAKVRGIAAGAAMNLALGCDLVLAADDARFSEIFIRRGLSLDFGGSWLLPRLVGERRAKEIAFFGDWIPAPEAERMGLINRALPAAELDAEVASWAARLAAAPPIALSMTKRLIDHGAQSTLREALDAEAMAVGVNSSTRDMREAHKAFLEKREPRFQGR